jgi:hypothetical protein
LEGGTRPAVSIKKLDGACFSETQHGDFFHVMIEDKFGKKGADEENNIRFWSRLDPYIAGCAISLKLCRILSTNDRYWRKNKIFIDQHYGWCIVNQRYVLYAVGNVPGTLFTVATKLKDVRLISEDKVMEIIIATLTTLSISMEVLKGIEDSDILREQALSGRGQPGGDGGPPGGDGGRSETPPPPDRPFSQFGFATPIPEKGDPPKDGMEVPELPGLQQAMLCCNTPVEVREIPPQSHSNHYIQVRSMDTPSGTAHFCTGVRRADRMEVVFKVVSLPQGYIEREARMLLLAQV